MTFTDAKRFLPHRPPFVMIDSLSYDPDDERHASAAFIVTADNVLVRDGALTAGGLVETWRRRPALQPLCEGRKRVGSRALDLSAR